MRFAEAYGLMIPEGEVVRIAADGVTLWEQQSSDGLPAGYTACEYIQFSGAQQVDTGITPTKNTKIETTFTRENDGAKYFYGVRDSANAKSVTAYLSSGGSWRFGNTYRAYTVSLNSKHTAIVDSTGIIMDGSKGNYGQTVNSFTAISTLTVGASRGTSGGLGSSQFVGKVYAFKMYTKDELVLDFWPCMNPQGVYGFWENVTRKFVPSATGTAFTGG